ncbi:MAG: hypothetical protein ABI612_18325 [Betaproteobacteria bacterium]
MTDAWIVFCHWLAGQLPFVQVSLGIGFLMLVVPVLLAVVAIVVTRAEAILEQALTSQPTVLHRLAAHITQTYLSPRQSRPAPLPKAPTVELSRVKLASKRDAPAR